MNVKAEKLSAQEFTTVLAQLQAEQRLRTDAILNTRDHVTLEPVATAAGGDVQIRFNTPQLPQLDGTAALITPFAHRQVAERSGIPLPYYRRMLADQPDLLVDNVHTWWRSEPEMRLARTIRPVSLQNGQASIGAPALRGWLSDRFRVLDNLPFLTTVLTEAEAVGAEINSVHLDDERFYMKLVSPKIEAEIRRGDHTFLKVPDVLQLGIVVRNSEVGDGRVSVRPFVYRLICHNGLISMKEYAQVHLGARNDLGMLSEEAVEADAKAIWLQVRDYVRNAFREETLVEAVEMFERADKTKINTEAALAVANVVSAYDLTGDEGRGVLERYLRANEDTMFGLVNAVTQYAHEGAGDYRRQVELEEVGGKLLASAPADVLHLVGRAVPQRDLEKVFSVGAV